MLLLNDIKIAFFLQNKTLINSCIPFLQNKMFNNKLLVSYPSMLILGPSIHGLVTDVQVNVYIGNKLSRLSFQN